MSFIATDEFSVKITKITLRIGVLWTHTLLFSFWLDFNSMDHGHINQVHTSQKPSFTNIWDLQFNFVECESFLESDSPDILTLCETNLYDSIDSDNISVRGYLLPLIWKDSTTYMHHLAVYVKDGLPFYRTCLYKTLQILTSVFNSLYFTQCLTSLSSINHLLHLYLFYFI